MTEITNAESAIDSMKTLGLPPQGGSSKVIMPLDFDNIPEELKHYSKWVVWKAENKVDGKMTKIPVNPSTGNYASTNNPATWGSYEDAVEFYRKTEGIAGIGFVFTKDDPFCGIDLDDCRNLETGEIDEWALQVLKEANSYSEISPSGKGAKIFAKGALPGSGRNFGSIEMYATGQYFTLTGQRLEEYPGGIEDRHCR